MTVKEYYYEHFTELAPDKQFHFATRMKNYFGVHDFDVFLAENMPSTNLSAIFANNDYSKVNNYTLRKPFFEKYPDLYGVEAALFRVHHLLIEYGVDLRDDFVRVYSRDKLYQLSDSLLRDVRALAVLSTWAVNVIYLTEELFPREKSIVKELCDVMPEIISEMTDSTLLIYLYTHIIICESGFYKEDLKESDNLDTLKILLDKCAEVVSTSIDTASLDACVEFLVCCEMVGTRYNNLRQKISEICDEFKKDSPYLINYRRARTPGSYFHSLNGAEHINVLYIMSDLDK